MNTFKLGDILPSGFSTYIVLTNNHTINQIDNNNSYEWCGHLYEYKWAPSI